MSEARTLNDIARQLVSDIDEMYSTKLSAAQYDAAIAKVLDAFDNAHDLRMAVPTILPDPFDPLQ